MSRATVRAALATYFAPPSVTFLNTVFATEPKIIHAVQQLPAPGNPSGAAAFPYIEREKEVRIALGGAPGPGTGGKKRIDYDVALVVKFRSNRQRAEDAMADYDTLIENIKEKLRADRNIGVAPGVVFQAGEGPAGIEVISDLPQIDKNITHIWSAVRFQVVEIITT